MIVAASLPGVVVGYFIRVRFFADPRAFQVFVALVLVYLALRLLTGRNGTDPGSASGS